MTKELARQDQLAKGIRALHAHRTDLSDAHGLREDTIRQICLKVRHDDVGSRVFIVSRDSESAVGDRAEGKVSLFQHAVEHASCRASVTALLDFKTSAQWTELFKTRFLDAITAETRRKAA